MTTLYLVRHGHKFSEPGDPRLTELGIQQAQQTGRFLAQFPISHIISSPLKRAAETAEHIGEQLNLPHRISEALLERMNWGDPSVARDDFVAEWIVSTHDRDYQPKWGDSSRVAGERLQQFIHTLQSDQPHHIVLVTHGGLIADYLRSVFDEAALQPLYKEYPEGRDYLVYNCAVTSIIFDHGTPTIGLLNCAEHLDTLSE